MSSDAGLISMRSRGESTAVVNCPPALIVGLRAWLGSLDWNWNADGSADLTASAELGRCSGNWFA